MIWQVLLDLPRIFIMILKITNMKKILICIGGLLMGTAIFAQFPGIAAGNGKGQAVPSIGHFYGKIVSDSLNKPVEGASVVQLQ
jgi:hypothetical protein